MYMRVPFHLNPVRELEWMIAPSAYSSGIKYPSRRGRTPSPHGRPIVLGDSRHDGGSLGEEAAPLLGAGLGPRAGRSRIASLDMLMNLFFVYCNGLRSQEGMGRVPSEVIAVVG